MSGVCDEILLTIGEDGIAREYDDTWDITIHCESMEEYESAMRRLTELSELHWIPFHKRPLTEEEQKEHKDWCWILDCELPDDNQEVLISSPYFGVYIDTFYNDGECSFDGGEEIKEGMAWMPLPEPYREEGGEE